MCFANHVFHIVASTWLIAPDIRSYHNNSRMNLFFFFLPLPLKSLCCEYLQDLITRHIWRWHISIKYFFIYLQFFTLKDFWKVLNVSYTLQSKTMKVLGTASQAWNNPDRKYISTSKFLFMYEGHLWNCSKVVF